VSNVLEILDLAEAGQLQLSLKKEADNLEAHGDAPVLAPAVAFQDPLDAADRQEIAWYFQEYPDNPLGEAKARAVAVETGLRNLGRLLFELVFRRSEAAQGIYDTASRDGLEKYQLLIISQRPEFLALPWELLNEPQAGYLSTRLAAIVRSANANPMPPFTGQLPTEQFNVLLLSPMPFLEQETSSPTLAPVVLKALESLDVAAELDFLRPPTLAALADRLRQRPGYYHLVQFDGFTTTAPGVLVFEAEDHRPDPVLAPRVAELLVAARVPAVLINSGGPASAVSPERCWAASATYLTEGGVPLGVTLPYPLAGTGREYFIQRFYQALTQGTDIAGSVALARRALMDNPLRATASGKVVFWDWVTPTVYQSRLYTPPPIQKVEAPKPLTPPTEAPHEPEIQIQLPQEGPYGLVGRDAEFRTLERIFQQQPVALLSGSTGIGKTEMALGFARWLQKTGERPGGIFYTTFEVGAGLVRVIHEIGTALAGLNFPDLNAEQQRRQVVDYLCEQPCLLIWDEVERIAGFPNGAPGLLDQTEQAELNAFLSEVSQGRQTWVLLLSRREDEPWLSVPHQPQQLAGLNPHDRLELLLQMLEKLGIESGQLGQAYLELLDFLAGNPLAMQIALPLLKQVPVSALLGEVRKVLEQLPQTAHEEGRDPRLTALMEYSFSRMSHRHRTHLPFLALFQRRVILDILSHITQERVYRTVLGEELGWGACRTLLRSAREAGLLEAISPSVYQIHPAFPWFYGRKLHRQVPASGLRQLESEFLKVYADTADYFMETLYENQDTATTGVLAEEGNLAQALALALEAQEWDQAQVLVQPLAQVYRMQKRYPELRRLRRQLLQSVGFTAAEAEARGAIELWLYLVGTEANEATDLRELDHAEALNRQLLAYLTSRPDGATDPRTAAVYHQFGVIAWHRRRLAEAEHWLGRSLEIIESGDDREAVADDYYHLGLAKQSQRYYTEAKQWFSKALEIHQRLQDQEELIKDYKALGAVAQLRFEYKEAESWYNRAREILEEFRDEENVIQVYHQLGTVYHAQYMFEEAESWYKQALTLSDRLGMERQMAVEFHHLGLLMQAWELFYEDAEEWYQLALEKYEALGDQRGVGDECRQMGVLFHQQKRFDEAERWYHRARGAFEEIRDLQRTASTYGQLGMIAEERGNLPEALESAARTYALAMDHNLSTLIIQVKAHLGRLRDKYGEENFTQWWRNFTGGDPPTDLDVDTSTII